MSQDQSPTLSAVSGELVANTRVKSTQTLLRPAELCEQMPASDAIYQTVLQARQTVQNILQGRDDRPMVVVGPCSIHDPQAALDYAKKLKQLADEVSDRLFVVMRVYFEKPRTTIGWKGLINDPDLNGSFNMGKGLRLARRLLLEINELGLPAATEILEPFTPQYIGDLLSWVAVGARTTESQTHRQMASGLSAPVGFKNSTDGNLQVAIDAIKSAAHPHTFLGINEAGETAVINTSGNVDTHLILRGGSDGTNYEHAEVTAAAQRLADAGLTPKLMVDCSHANSGKKHDRQAIVWHDLIEQIRIGRDNGQPEIPVSAIVGMMLESNLNEGRQNIPEDLSKLEYGVSVTDACIDWPTTETLLKEGYDRLG